MTDSTQTPPKKAGLLASTLVVSSMTMLSRVLGLIRDVVIARMLGASAGADAFFVALKIPNLLRRLFAEGAFNQAFVPVLSEYRNKGSMAATKLLVDRVAGTLGGTLMLVTLLGGLGAPLIIWVFAPGFGRPQAGAGGNAASDLPYLLADGFRGRHPEQLEPVCSAGVYGAAQSSLIACACFWRRTLPRTGWRWRWRGGC